MSFPENIFNRTPISIFLLFSIYGLLYTTLMHADNTEIDVMVLYTPAVESVNGGENGTLAHVIAMIESTNQAYENSNVSIQLNLVHSQKVVYTETTSFNTDLSRLKTQNDGFMDEVFALRNTHGADLVCLIRNGTSNGTAGLAYLLESLALGGDPDWAFSVVASQSAVFGTFAHELGHNMGAHHDHDNAPVGGGLYSYSHGHRFYGSDSVQYRTIMSYAPGSRIQYFSNPNVDFLSNATGVSVGNSNEADNALTLNNSKATIQNYRVSVNSVPEIFRQPNDIQAVIGKNVIFSVGYLAQSNATVSWYRGNRGDETQLVGSGNNLDYSVLGNTNRFWVRISDSNGSVDSRSFSVVGVTEPGAPAIKDQASEDGFWSGSMEGCWQEFVPSVSYLDIISLKMSRVGNPSGFTAVLTDLDGTTIAERVLVTNASGWIDISFGVWVTEGTKYRIAIENYGDDTNYYNWYFQYQQNPYLAGSSSIYDTFGQDGDYCFRSYGLDIASQSVSFVEENDIDSDGNADLVWQNTSNNVLTAWIMNGAGVETSRTQLSNGIATGLYIDSGDINRDGNLDLLFLQTQDSSTHYAEIWFNDGSGGFSQKKKHVAIDTDWKLVGLGDMNGDAVPDLVWQNSGNGRVTVWYLDENGNKSSGSILVDWIADWKVVSLSDMNADENQDLIWQKSSGSNTQISVWHLDGSGARESSASVATLAGTVWQLVGAADYNVDSYLDILLQNRDTGKLVCWLLNGNYQKIGSYVLSGAVDSWRIGHWSWEEDSTLLERYDFDEDGNADLFWQNLSNDIVSCWLLDGGGSKTSSVQLANGTSNDRLVGIADMNNDGNQDAIFAQQKNVSIHYPQIWYGNGSGGFGSTKTYQDISVDWKLVGVGDMNEDGNQDLIWQNNNNGRVTVWNLDGNGSLLSSSILVSWMQDWKIATVVDLNADSHQDLVWQRQKGSVTHIAVWYLDESGTRTGSSIVAALPSVDWKLVGIADYNDDDLPDFLWQFGPTGKLVCWTLNESLVRTGVITLAGSMGDWRIAHWSW